MVSYIGYKAFDKDLKCIDFQYEIGKSYEMDEKPELCARGYHYCGNLRDIFRYKESDCRICIVKAYGDINSGNYSKSCTNKIEILKEINISKEDRIRYVYANRHVLSTAKLKDILSEEFILDKYINDPDWQVRTAVVRQGYGLDKLINDPHPEVRTAVATQGYGLDILVNDPDWQVRRFVAKQGYGLDKLINDKDWEVRITIVRQGYGLDKLINDPDRRVRCAVANYGYGLDKLINDPDWQIRCAVADQGYKLEKLINDKNPIVQYVAKTKLNKKNKE